MLAAEKSARIRFEDESEGLAESLDDTEVCMLAFRRFEERSFT